MSSLARVPQSLTCVSRWVQVTLRGTSVLLSWPEPELTVNDRVRARVVGLLCSFKPHDSLSCTVLCTCYQAITPSPKFLAYAVPLSEVTAAGIVASTPCGLEVAGDGDANHATLAGTVVGETTVSFRQPQLCRVPQHSQCAFPRLAWVAARTGHNFRVQVGTIHGVRVELKPHSVP